MEGADDIAALVPATNREGAGGQSDDVRVSPALEGRPEGEKLEGPDDLLDRLLDRRVPEALGEPEADRVPLFLGELGRPQAGRPPKRPNEAVDEEPQLGVRPRRTLPDPEPERRPTSPHGRPGLGGDEPNGLKTPEMRTSGVPVDSRQAGKLGDGPRPLGQGFDDRESGRIAEEAMTFGAAK